MCNDIISDAKKKAFEYVNKKNKPGVFPPEADSVQDYIRGFIAGYGYKLINKKENETIETIDETR